MNHAAERIGVVVEEFERIELGDARLNGRARRVARALASQPEMGFPRALATEAELEGFYRFLSNDKVTAERLLRPHVDATVGRLTEHGLALVIHDNTEFRFGGVQGRSGLGEVGPTGSGFLAHFALAIAPDCRDPLGVLAIDSWVRLGDSPTQERRKDPNKYKELKKRPSEQDRWFTMVERVAERVAGRAELIHVMDSEADDYILLWNLQRTHSRHVLRLCYDRRLDAEATGSRPGEKTKEFVTRAKIRATRQVKLSRRKRAIAGGRTRRSAPRLERDATLKISALSVVIRRPGQCGNEAPSTLQVNLVSVREKNPPPDVVPIEWFLLTTEPIDTEDQVLRVVDIYRARWQIEEYFKALKTGCAFEKRQLETRMTLLKALALFTPVAWALLRMRTLSRSSPTARATTVLSPVQIRLLRERTKLPLTSNSTVEQAWMAVARLGGHLKQNGPPGWQTLGRGYSDLLMLEAGYKIAMAKRCDQS
jgi:hypothetical protein